VLFVFFVVKRAFPAAKDAKDTKNIMVPMNFIAEGGNNDGS